VKFGLMLAGAPGAVDLRGDTRPFHADQRGLKVPRDVRIDITLGMTRHFLYAAARSGPALGGRQKAVARAASGCSSHSFGAR